MPVGIIIVDHGSQSSQSNRLLDDIAARFVRLFCSRYPIVEAAHMELAEPSIASAYAECVRRGAEKIIVCPFFLGPGKHWKIDIPRLTQEAAMGFPQTSFAIAAPLGVDDLILKLLYKRIREAHENDRREVLHAT